MENFIQYFRFLVIYPVIGRKESHSMVLEMASELQCPVEAASAQENISISWAIHTLWEQLLPWKKFMIKPIRSGELQWEAKNYLPLGHFALSG